APADLEASLAAEGETTMPVPGPTAAAAPGGSASDPAALVRQHQCLLCHQLDGEGGAIGPPLTDVGARLGPEEIRRAILTPGADTTAGYEAVAGTMPANFGDQLTAAQLEALVEHLA